MQGKKEKFSESIDRSKKRIQMLQNQIRDAKTIQHWMEMDVRVGTKKPVQRTNLEKWEVKNAKGIVAFGLFVEHFFMMHAKRNDGEKIREALTRQMHESMPEGDAKMYALEALEKLYEFCVKEGIITTDNNNTGQ